MGNDTFFTQETGYAIEASFGVATNTVTYRVPTNGLSRVTLRQERMPDLAARSRQNAQGVSHIGGRSASLEFDVYFTGYGTATTGTLVAQWINTLLRYGLGGYNISQVGGTVNAPTSAVQFTTTGVTGVAGAVVRVGSKGDGRADGQAAVVQSTGPMVLDTALPATPNAADVVYVAGMFYHDESTSNSLSSFRFVVQHTTTGAQYVLRGGQLASLGITFPHGDMPVMSCRFEFANWDRVAITTPTSNGVGFNDCAPVAGGSVFLQAAGTATRNVVEAAEIELSIDMGLAPRVGPGGVGNYQSIGGWHRTRCVPTLTLTVPWVDTYETWWDTSNQSIVNKHCLITPNVSDGSRTGGVYLPNLFPIGPRPSAPVNVNELSYVRFSMRGTEGADTTNELTRSAVRIFQG